MPSIRQLKKEINNEINFLLNNLTTSGRIIFTTPNYGGLMYFIEKISNFFKNILGYNSVSLTVSFQVFFDSSSVSFIHIKCLMHSRHYLTASRVITFIITSSIYYVFVFHVGTKLLRTTCVTVNTGFHRIL